NDEGDWRRGRTRSCGSRLCSSDRRRISDVVTLQSAELTFSSYGRIRQSCQRINLMNPEEEATLVRIYNACCQSGRGRERGVGANRERERNRNRRCRGPMAVAEHYIVG